MTMAGWLSVWPPESASAVMSSAIGMRVAHSACSAVIAPVATSSRSICAGRRGHELGGDLDPRDLGDDAVGRDNTPRLIAHEPRHPITNHRQCQIEKCGRLDQPHPPPEQQVDDGRLDLRARPGCGSG